MNTSLLSLMLKEKEVSDKICQMKKTFTKEKQEEKLCKLEEELHVIRKQLARYFLLMKGTMDDIICEMEFED